MQVIDNDNFTKYSRPLFRLLCLVILMEQNIFYVRFVLIPLQHLILTGHKFLTFLSKTQNWSLFNHCEQKHEMQVFARMNFNFKLHKKKVL